MVQEKKGIGGRKMKNKKAVPILIAVLAVLLVVYFGLQSWNKKQEEEEESGESILVTELDADTITAVSYNVGNGELAFEKQDGTWYYAEDKDFPLDQSYLQNIVDGMCAINADRKLEDGDALADYGLEEPAYTVQLTDSEGNTTQIGFGDLTGDNYYVNVNGSDQVYTVASTALDDLQYTLDEMAQLDEYPSIGSGNLKKEVITENGETTTYDSENEDQAEDIAAVAGGLGAVTLSEAADYSVEDADLAGYGLDEESRITVEATYTEDEEEKVLTIYIGTEDGDGSRYVMMNDSRIVYLISTEICDNILNK